MQLISEKKLNAVTMMIGVLLLAMMAISSCSTKSPIDSGNLLEATTIGEFDCITAPFSFAYSPYDIPDERPTPSPAKSAGKPQLPLNLADQYNINNVLNLSIDSNDELWLTMKDGRIIRFSPSTNVLNEYTLLTVDDKRLYPDGVLVDENNILWVLIHQDFTVYLFRHDSSTDQFVLKHELITDFDVKGWLYDFYPDSTGIVIKLGESIVRLLPDSGQLEHIIGPEEGYSVIRFTIDPYGKIWMSAEAEVSVSGKQQFTNSVFSYDISTGEVLEHTAIKKKVGPSSLLYSPPNRIWAGDHGWFEITEGGTSKWYELFRSPIFIVDKIPDIYDTGYYWTRPRVALATHDRFIWYDSMAGVAVLDYVSEDWCLLTNFPSPIAEDSDHNIWIAGEGQIYKLEVAP